MYEGRLEVDWGRGVNIIAEVAKCTYRRNASSPDCGLVMIIGPKWRAYCSYGFFEIASGWQDEVSVYSCVGSIWFV